MTLSLVEKLRPFGCKHAPTYLYLLKNDGLLIIIHNNLDSIEQIYHL